MGCKNDKYINKLKTLILEIRYVHDKMLWQTEMHFLLPFTVFLLYNKKDRFLFLVWRKKALVSLEENSKIEYAKKSLVINIEDYKCSVKRFDLFSAKEKMILRGKTKRI